MSEGGFDPTKIGTALLSNQDRTVTGNAFGRTSVRSQQRHGWFIAKGKYYFEFRRDTLQTDGIFLGLCSTDYTVSPAVGVSAVYYSIDGKFYVGSSSPLIGISSTAGDIISFAVDFDVLWIYCRLNSGNWNNDPTANPATTTGGISFDFNMDSMSCGPVDPSEVTTVRANAGAFTLTPPAGFLPWNAATTTLQTTNLVTVGRGTPFVGLGIKVNVTGAPAATSVGTVTTTGSATVSVSVTGQALTPTVGTATINNGWSLVPAGQALTASVVSVSVVGKASASPTGFLLQTLIGGPSIFAGGSVGVPPGGNQVAVSIGTVSLKFDFRTVGVSGQAVTISAPTATVRVGKDVPVTGLEMLTDMTVVDVFTSQRLSVAAATSLAQVGGVEASGSANTEVAGLEITALLGGSVSFISTSFVAVRGLELQMQTKTPVTRGWGANVTDFHDETWQPITRQDGRMHG